MFQTSRYYWTTGQAPLREMPHAASRKLVDIPFGTIVHATGHLQNDWVEIIYITAQTRFAGWCYGGYVESLVDPYPRHVVSIQSPTINPHDAAQYMVWRGKVQYNLCGEICVCYIVGDDLEIMLSKWEAKSLSVFKRVFGNGMARGTDLGELDSMLAVYNYMPSLRLQNALMDPLLKRPVVTPGRLLNLLIENRIIVGVKISKATGNLQASGILHWVVLEEVIPHGVDRGLVKLYNPFPNQHQTYSWAELKASMGNPYGLVVKR